MSSLDTRFSFAQACARACLPCVVLVLGACSLPKPYTLDIQQGTVLDQKMLSRLNPGMTRNQVGLALGTPLLADPLHANRWDYVYYTRHDGAVGEWRHLTLTFKDDRLAEITGDVTVATGTASGPGATAPAAASPVTPGLPTPPPATTGPAPGLPASPPAVDPNGVVPSGQPATSSARPG